MNQVDTAPVSGSLLHRLSAGDRATVSFAGQGGAYVDALRQARGAFPGSRRIIGAALQSLDAFAADPRVEATGRLRSAEPFERVFDTDGVGSWASAAVSYPLIFMAQAIRWEELRRRGLRQAIREGRVVGATGHSQGMLSACFVAELGASDWDDGLFERYLRLAGWLGVMVEVGYVDATGAPALLDGATPMVAVTGLRTDELAQFVAAFRARQTNGQPPTIGLRNTYQRHVVSAPPLTLAAFVRFVEDALARRAKAKKAGRAPGRLPRVSFDFLPVSGAFHTPAIEGIVPTAIANMRRDGAVVDAGAFAFPVLRCSDGAPLQGEDVMHDFVCTQYSVPVDWPTTWRAIRATHPFEWAVDVGPGDGVYPLTRSCLEGTGVGTVAAGTTLGMAQLADQPLPVPARPWAEFAPTVRDGRIINAFSEATGRPPVILPGMTPTTVDVPIVAAAANAGFVAEIAGGGQVTREVWEERVRELHEQLEPGAEVVFNALYLDRYLWGLHFEGDGVVAAARRRGAPICGVTVSAGIPEADEAKALLDAWAAQGMWLNAFKPGTIPQVRQVSAIAAAATEHTIFVHLEGGKAGGHHSWEDLEDLLLDGYATLRRHPNVVLCVGGGVHAPARAVELLDGTWAARHGREPMPVDAVLLGTVTMACREATATAGVKQALAAAPGSEQWVVAGDVAGAITSGKSQLDADIHYLDTAASRCGRLLDEVAGDTAKIRARRDEIIAALAQTAKPYLGDLEAMSWGALLDRLVSLMAIGVHGRYDDGAWVDRSWRQRVYDVIARGVRRASATATCTMPLAGLDALDDPTAALATVRAAVPTLDQTALTPSDIRWFLAEVCRRPGKPVPFVPVIDAEVRRWYKSDSLWQAQHPAYTADQVLVIPGPEAVAGIERADEPVAALLQRYVDAIMAASATRAAPAADGPPTIRGVRCWREQGRWAVRFSDDASLRWREALRQWVDAPSVSVLAAPVWHEGTVARPNPLHAVIRGSAGDEIVETDAGWRYSPDGAHGEFVEATIDGDMVRVAVCTGTDDPTRAFVLWPTSIPGRPGWRLDPATEATARAAFHDAAMGGTTEQGVVLSVDGLFETASFETTLQQSSGVAYGRTAGARGISIPDGWLFSTAWPALFACLAVDELGDGFERLVHASNEVVHGETPLDWGQTLVVSARVERVADGAAGREVDCEVRFQAAEGGSARMMSRFLIRGDFTGSPWRERRRIRWSERFVVSDEGTARYLREWGGWLLDTPERIAAGATLEITASGTFDRPRSGASLATAAGVVSVDGDDVGTVALDLREPLTMPPLEALLTTVGAREHREHARASKTLATIEDRAPRSLAAFARAGRDRNPIHRSQLYARYAGFEQPIVHGMWTCARLDAFLRDDVLRGRVDRLLRAKTEFLAPLLPGERLRLTARRVGITRAGLLLELDAAALREDAAVVVARTRATVRPPRTAWLFPGQGIQTQGMGQDAMQRSAAARAVWNRADAYTRAAHGFSVLHIVRDNPTSLEVQGTVLRHPQGVLHLTQFTQVSMAVLAHAQVAELRESGLYFDGDVTCGHSVGEYNALAALAGVISLEAGIDAVYRRGQAMHRLVPRDARGESGYRMGVARPHYAGIGHQELEALVGEVASTTGAFIEIVNFNVRGRQYAVTGTLSALAALEARLRALAPPGAKSPWVEVPGIDVPFHSRALRAGVAAFREALDAALPTELDTTPLLGRYVPNLVPRPFSLDRAFSEEVRDWTDSPVLSDLLERWDTVASDERGRALLIELLAYQFASPVRWIETQELLFDPAGLAVDRIVEVGLGSQPTVANMARYSRSLYRGAYDHIEVLNAEADADLVLYADADAAVDDVPATAASPDAAEADAIPDAPASPVTAPTAHASNASAPADRASTVLEALRALIANQARVRVDQVGDTETIEELFDGVSARRNQALMDIGAEFGVGSIDGAHEVPLTALAAAIEARGGKAHTAGRYLRAVQDTAVQKLGARVGVARKELSSLLATRYGLGDGLQNSALTVLALAVRAGASARGGDLGTHPDAAPASKEELTQVLDGVIAQLASMTGMVLGPLSAGGASGGVAVDAAVVEELEARVLGADGALAQWARDLLERVDAPAHGVEAVDDSASRIANRIVAEFGEDFVRWITPRFDGARHVVFANAWAHAQRDVVRAFFDAMNADHGTAALATTCRALAAFGTEARVAQTAAWCADEAERRDRPDVAAPLRTIVAGALAAPIGWVPMAPHIAMENGNAVYEERPRSSGALDLEVARWFEAPVSLRVDGAAGATRAWRDAAIAALEVPLAFAGETAVVTGASPGSIAFEMVRHLLRGGARVVVTTTTYDSARLRTYRTLYREAAAPGAELHVVPFNQASSEDVASLVDWLFSRVTVQEGATVREVKAPFRPTIVVPFGAMGDLATLDGADGRSEAALRAMLVGVERLVTSIGARYRRDGAPGRACHVVLPLSPNHGTFGGDGFYGEAKAALEALLNKASSERDAWGAAMSFCGARIGWVRGTGLMDANNAVAAELERAHGVTTWSASEMGHLLVALCSDGVRAAAAASSLLANVDAGMADVTDLRAIIDGARADLAARAAAATREQQCHETEARLLGRASQTGGATMQTLPAWSDEERHVVRPWRRARPDVALDDAIVITGIGEVSPWGSVRTRWAYEVDPELSPAAVLELAWMTGRVEFRDQAGGAWFDTETDEVVDEADIAARYRDVVLQHAGIRVVEPDVAGYDPDQVPVLSVVYLDRDLTFQVSSRAEAETFVQADPGNTLVREDAARGQWTVTRRAGSEVRVPRSVRWQRHVAGLVPTGFDPKRFGIPAEMADATDRVTCFALVATVDAFLSAGLRPEELLSKLHPARVGNTQGSGIGGMESLRRLYLDELLDRERQPDVIQESLINVMAGYVVQSFVGSYGPMSHPVAACATAAVSLEEAFDKIQCGKADLIVAGGFDDIGEAGVRGFGDMNATADTREMERKGIEPAAMCRPNDVRRDGFLEAQGGGAFLVTRGSVARDLGLPVDAVVAWVGSFGDGIQTSVPAPGLGAVASALGGASSPLGAALARWQMHADDVRIVYKHDTSTRANDPNENRLHQTVQRALGRTAGAPLFVVSQKAITGHPKGGAAAFQIAGACQAMRTGVIPGNRNLDTVDPSAHPHDDLVFSDAPVAVGEAGRIDAAVITSLGFGHVSAFALLVHPDAFAALLDDPDAWAATADARRVAGRRRRERILAGLEPAFVKRTDPGFGTANRNAAETAMLLDPDARWDESSAAFASRDR